MTIMAPDLEWPSGRPKSRHLNNTDICHILRCTPTELKSLKTAARAEMMKPIYGPYRNETLLDKKLFGEGSFDRHRVYQDQMWEAVAESCLLFGHILGGWRWGKVEGRPANLEVRIRQAEDAVVRHITLFWGGTDDLVNRWANAHASGAGQYNHRTVTDGIFHREVFGDGNKVFTTKWTVEDEPLDEVEEMKEGARALLEMAYSDHVFGRFLDRFY